MKSTDLFAYIDHTLLTPTATRPEIARICREALEYRTASACIPPSYVPSAHAEFPSLNICTVVGFPLGYAPSAAKARETEVSLLAGASEIDMVINIAEFKNHNYELVSEEIRELKRLCGAKILKVIVETAYMDQEELIELTKLVGDSGADFIKTSTGFAARGASFADVEIFAQYKSPSLQIKAAGGIKSVADMIRFVELGATRLGTSSGIRLLTDKNIAAGN
jgi:deoxyribose-phosphate aldolase